MILNMVNKVKVPKTPLLYYGLETGGILCDSSLLFMELIRFSRAFIVVLLELQISMGKEGPINPYNVILKNTE